MFNNYVKEVFDAAKTAIEQQIEIEAEIKDYEKKYKADLITAKAMNEKILEIKHEKDNVIVDAHHKIMDIADEFKIALEKAEFITGDMVDPDYKLFEAGITLTENQIQHLVAKHRDNPFMIQLITEYCIKDKILVNLPLPKKVKADRFDRYCADAKYAIYSPHSLQAGLFLAGKYDPELDADCPLEALSEDEQHN